LYNEEPNCGERYKQDRENRIENLKTDPSEFDKFNEEKSRELLKNYLQISKDENASDQNEITVEGVEKGSAGKQSNGSTGIEKKEETCEPSKSTVRAMNDLDEKSLS